MSSGVGVKQACITAYKDLKGRKHKYVIFNLNPKNTEIEVEKESSAQDYDDFIADLPEKQCRWAVYDFAFTTAEGLKMNKICFIMWSPDGAEIKQKMVFASSKDALRRSLDGIAVEIQATDFSEVAHETVQDKCMRLR